MPQRTRIQSYTFREITAHDRLDLKDTFEAIFHTGKAPLRGSVRVSVEEGLIRSIAADAVTQNINILYDQTIKRSAGIGRLYNQTIRQLSHAVVRGSADAVLNVLRRHF